MNWMADADALRHTEHFKVPQSKIDFTYLQERADDFYISILGELFTYMRQDHSNAEDWSRIGNALSQFASDEKNDFLRKIGVDSSEAKLFASAAFYFGGFPASAYLTLRSLQAIPSQGNIFSKCFDLLARPRVTKSESTAALILALREGRLESIERLSAEASENAKQAIKLGPREWIGEALYERLLNRFKRTNIRAVLPDGSSEFWTPLVESFLKRPSRQWEFFPSQIQAIESGLLSSQISMSLQMPTSSGKTTICETLLFWHAKRTQSDISILLVPYRSLASELRSTLVKRLNEMGISAGCAYGGTVPTPDEIHDLQEMRVIVATPETLSGLLSANSDLIKRISLVICDEGHLLDSDGRGVSLELLLARMNARELGAPRNIFVSAIVPNIEEINAWLGGTSESVVRSDYRPAVAEFALLKQTDIGKSITLEMHPHVENNKFSIYDFLSKEDFKFLSENGRTRTYPFSSIKTQAVSCARKALEMGTVAIFSATKQGNQGAIGLADELLSQIDTHLPLPLPINYANQEKIRKVADYFAREYGEAWIGTLAISVGAVLHHGDIPQETREVIEELVRNEEVRFVICTSTLAEGVNLPIRTLVLYSVQRRLSANRIQNLLSREIKNLVGRAGRAGATTKGLVVCANENQWPIVSGVALGKEVESVHGALSSLVNRLNRALKQQGRPLTNELLENLTVLQPLTDGIDSTLIDLISEEVGEAEFVSVAANLVSKTFAARKLDLASVNLLKEVFSLRAKKITECRSNNRIHWARETGARLRLISSVEKNLLPLFDFIQDETDPTASNITKVLLDWAWALPEMQASIRDVFRLSQSENIEPLKEIFFKIICLWLSGKRYAEIAQGVNLSIDDLLRILTGAMAFSFQTLVEQGLALLKKVLEAEGRSIGTVLPKFPEHLRFGVTSKIACVISGAGIRHRSASIALGFHPYLTQAYEVLPLESALLSEIKDLLIKERTEWIGKLGLLVYEHTLQDVGGKI